MRDGLGRARRRGWSGVNVWGGELGKIWGGRQEHRDTNQPLGGTAPTGGGPPAMVGAHFSLWDPSTTPFFSCHRPLGHGGDTFPCPTCQHPRSPREGPRGTLVPGVTQHVGPPPLSHARPRGLGWRGVAAPVMLWGKKRGEFGKGGTEPGGGAGCGGTERAGDIGGLVGGRRSQLPVLTPYPGVMGPQGDQAGPAEDRRHAVGHLGAPHGWAEGLRGR